MYRTSWMLIVVLAANCFCLANTKSVLAQTPGFNARLEAQRRELNWELAKLQRQRVDLLIRIDALKTARSRLTDAAREGKIGQAALQRGIENLASTANQIAIDGNRFKDDRKAFDERMADYNERIKQRVSIEPRKVEFRRHAN